MPMASFRHPDPSVLRFALWLAATILLLSATARSPRAQELRIDPREIVALLPKDAIPAIRDATPLLMPVDAARGVRDSEQVLGVVIGGESRAYPIPFLSWHEIVNDTVAGVPIAATW